MHTIAELPEFIKRSQALLTGPEKKALIDHLARYPKAGYLIPETGGIRKLRWARQGMGKSGGARVIYYYHDENMPLYLLTIFSKGEKANLSKPERNTLAKLVKLLVQNWSKHHE
jgi:hypothetical protein